MAHQTTLEPALFVAGGQIARELGTWIFHIARTHPRLGDIVGWARVESSIARAAAEDQTRKAWSRLANWLEGLDPEHYPEQIGLVLDSTDAPWRGPASPKPSMTQASVLRVRNAKPLAVCTSCRGFGAEV